MCGIHSEAKEIKIEIKNVLINLNDIKFVDNGKFVHLFLSSILLTAAQSVKLNKDIHFLNNPLDKVRC